MKFIEKKIVPGPSVLTTAQEALMAALIPRLAGLEFTADGMTAGLQILIAHNKEQRA